MSIVFLVVGVLLVAYLTLQLTMSPDAGARGEDSGNESSNAEISNGKDSNGEISNGEISDGEIPDGKDANGEISDGNDANGEILRPDGEVIRKEQFKRH
jgi:hypothetical protein